MPSIMQPDQELRIKRVESCRENKGPHDWIKIWTEDNGQVPREQEQKTEKGDGKYLFAGHGCGSVLWKSHGNNPVALTVEVREGIRGVLTAYPEHSVRPGHNCSVLESGRQRDIVS